MPFELPISLPRDFLAKLTPKQIEDENNKRRFKWESEASEVCKLKIAHYEQTGKSPFKLQLYKDKLKDKRSILSKLRKLVS